MSLTIPAIAIFISIASLSFAIYQYKQSHRIKIDGKISELLKEIYSFRLLLDERKTEYLNTDYIPDYESLFLEGAATIDSVISILEKKNISIKEYYAIERKFMGMRNNVELTCRKIDEAIKFNAECIEHGYGPIDFESQG